MPVWPFGWSALVGASNHVPAILELKWLSLTMLLMNLARLPLPRSMGRYTNWDSWRGLPWPLAWLPRNNFLVVRIGITDIGTGLGHHSFHSV